MKKLLLIYPLFFVSCMTFDVLHVYSQQPTLEWARVYPDSGGLNAYANVLALDDSGNVYVAGNMNNNSTWSSYCTVKYNPAGIRQWTSNYYGPYVGGRQILAIALDKSSNVYVTGGSYENGTNSDCCTIKYSSDGVQQWIKYYDGFAHANDYAQKIAIDNTGNIYITGVSSVGGTFTFQIVTIKYSPDGRQLWTQRYGVPDVSTYANGMLIDDSCNIYITGANNYRSVTLKYDSSGILKWEQVYDGGFGSQANALALDNNNNVCITGFCWGVVGQHIDYFTAKYSNQGSLQWSKNYNTDSLQYDSWYKANTIISDSHGDIYVSGDYKSVQGAPSWLCTVKYSEFGDILWVIKDSSFNTVGYVNLVTDKDNGIYVGCATNSYTTIKYDASGSVIWKETYAGGMPFDIVVDKNYNIYLTGEGVGGILTLKYSQPIGILPISSIIPGNFELHQNYPNPFNPKTVIKFQVSSYRFVYLAIYDILGRRVATLVNENLKPGEYETQWDASNYASGVYFYTLEAGNFVETKKMLLIK